MDSKEFLKMDACDICTTVTECCELGYCSECHCKLCDRCTPGDKIGPVLCDNCYLEKLDRETEGQVYQ